MASRAGQKLDKAVRLTVAVLLRDANAFDYRLMMPAARFRKRRSRQSSIRSRPAKNCTTQSINLIRRSRRRQVKQRVASAAGSDSNELLWLE